MYNVTLKKEINRGKIPGIITCKQTHSISDNDRMKEQRDVS